MLLFSDKDVPAVLPAQGLQLSDRQRGLPVGHRAERAIDQVNRREPGYDEGTEHALEKQGSGGGGREGKSRQVKSRLATHFNRRTYTEPISSKGHCWEPRCLPCSSSPR